MPNQKDNNSEQENNKRRSGIEAVQCLIEPVTQAALSSFHFLDSDSDNADDISKFNKIIRERYDEIKVTIDTHTFDPLDFFEINLSAFTHLCIRKVGRDRILRGRKLVEARRIKINPYVNFSEVLTVVIDSSKQSSYGEFYVWNFLKEKIGSYSYIPTGMGEIDVISPNPSKAREKFTALAYNEIGGIKSVIPYRFSLKEYIEKDIMTFMIHECDIKYLLEYPGVVDFEFQDLGKVRKYYGIEVLREFAKLRLLEIAPEDRNTRLFLDFLTYKGKFEVYSANSLIRSLYSHQAKKDIVSYSMSIGEIEENDIESAILLGTSNLN